MPPLRGWKQWLRSGATPENLISALKSCGLSKQLRPFKLIYEMFGALRQPESPSANKKVRSSMRGSPELLTWRSRRNISKALPPSLCAEHPHKSLLQTEFQLSSMHISHFEV
jgi:hypothetical protein